MSSGGNNSDYQRLGEAAVAAFHQGQHRQAADHYLAAFLCSHSDPWDLNRWQIFEGYTSILREKAKNTLRPVRQISKP